MDNRDYTRNVANDNGCDKTVKSTFEQAMDTARKIATEKEAESLGQEKTETGKLSRAFMILAKRMDEMDHNLTDNGTKYTPVVPHRRARIERRKKR